MGQVTFLTPVTVRPARAVLLGLFWAGLLILGVTIGFAASGSASAKAPQPLPLPIRAWTLSAADPQAPGCVLPAEWSDCTRRKLAKNAPFRDVYDTWILEAANAYGIHPAILKAVAHVESTMNPIAGSDAKPNGLCAMSPKNQGLKLEGFANRPGEDVRMDLWLYPSDRPKVETALSKEFNEVKIGTHPVTGNKSQLFPFWSPRGQILAAASYLHRLQAQAISVEEEDQQRVTHSYPVTAMLMSDLRDPLWVHRARYLVSMYNKGAGTIQRAVGSYYRIRHELPRDYGLSWETQNGEISDARFHEGKCHIWQVAGLCGEGFEGYFGEYSADFTFDVKSAKWFRRRR